MQNKQHINHQLSQMLHQLLFEIVCLIMVVMICLLINVHFQKMNKVKKIEINSKILFSLFLLLVDSMMFRNSKTYMGDNPIEGLDELARVTVDNELQDEV